MRLSDGLRAAAFDLDGTLIDTAPDLGAAMNRMLVMLDGEPLPYHRIRALIGDGVDVLVARALVESFGEAGAQHALREEATALFRRVYAANLFTDSRVYPGVMPALTRLERAGIALCCVTNKDSEFALPLLEAAGLAGFLAMTLCGDREEDRKPRPSLLLAACAQLGVAPGELLYVGDSQKDVQAARSAGCRMALVDYGYGGDGASECAPDALLGSLEEIDG